MGKRIYPLQPIKYWWAYDIDEVCDLYKKYKLHPQTVRQWLKDGLKTIDNTKPTLVYGDDLREFLGRQNQSSKCKLEFHQLYCVKCREAKEPYRKQIVVEQKAKFLSVKALCNICKNIMPKSYKLTDFPELKKIYAVVGVSQLYDTAHPTLNTHFPARDEKQLSEPSQWELF